MTATQQKTRVCFVLPATDSTNVGGMETVAKDLFHNLDPDKYDFTLVALSADNGILPRIDRARVRIEVLPKCHGLDRSLIPRLAAYFYSTRPALLHTFNFPGLIYTLPAAVLARVPAIVHAEHGRLSVPERALARQVRLGMQRRVDHVVAVSEDLRRLLCEQEGVAPEKVSVIINGVDTRPFDDPGFDREAYRRELGLGPGDFAVGTVGSLTEVKNQQLLIRAAALGSGFKVFIAGKGPLEAALRTLIEQQDLGGRVRLLGERSDIPRFTRSLDLFALSSLSEGTSLALLEAMAARLPVVVTEVGGNGAIVVRDHTGFLVPSQAPAALSERIAWCAAHREESRQLGLAGRARIDDEYSFARTADAYDRVFARVLAAKGLG